MLFVQENFGNSIDQSLKCTKVLIEMCKFVPYDCFVIDV